MATNVAKSTLTNALLKLSDAEVQDTICTAFKAAVKLWCKKKKPRGPFNDQFFRSLRNTRPNGRYIAQNTLREVPVIATMAAGAGLRTASGALRSAASVSLASAAAGPAATLVMGAWTAITGLAQASVGASFPLDVLAQAGQKGALFRDLAMAGQRVRFLDGLVGTPGRSLECKSPIDSDREQQAEDNAKLDKPNKGFRADGDTCYKKGEGPPPCPK